jgi:hypothetical protein
MNKREIRKLHPLLKIISKLPENERQVLLRYLTHDGCKGIYECIHNGLTNPTLREEDKNQMRASLIARKQKFRRLLKESNPDKKKQALLQVGEGVGLILEKVVPLLEQYLKSK